MKLKEITFVLENCDCITIDGKYIGDFLVEDIRTSIKRIACNAINKLNIVHTFAIEIHRDANKERCSFGCKDDKELVFDRLASWSDITQIEFKLVDDYSEECQEQIVENYHYYVNWVGDSDYLNDAQKNYISMFGNLYIVIADGKSIEDFFCEYSINNKEYMESICSIYEIGDKYYSSE